MQTTDSGNIIIYCSHSKDLKGQDFFRKSYNGREGYYIVFIGQDLIHLLAYPNVQIDGTFKSSPKLFLQLLTVHVIQGEHVSILYSHMEMKFENIKLNFLCLQTFPVVYALMSKKTTTLYQHLFNYLKEAFNWSPSNAMTDFECALQGALKKTFTGIQISGCLFHYTQVREIYIFFLCFTVHC